MSLKLFSNFSRIVSKSRTLASTFALVVLLPGCSLLFEEDIEDPVRPVDAVEITLSRASLVDAEFEHYKVTRGQFFRECGKNRRGSFIPTSTVIEPLGVAYRNPLLDRVSRLLDFIDTHNPHWKEAGNGLSLADPGVVKVKISTPSRHYEMETSVDSMSAPSSRQERALRRVITLLRGAAGDMCGNKVFYGIGF